MTDHSQRLVLTRLVNVLDHHVHDFHRDVVSVKQSWENYCALKFHSLRHKTVPNRSRLTVFLFTGRA